MMKVQVISDLTLESLSRSQLKNSDNEYTFIYTEDLIGELESIDKFIGIDAILVFFDPYFKKYHTKQIDLIFKSLLNLSERTSKQIFCTNLFVADWTNTDLSSSIGKQNLFFRANSETLNCLIDKTNFTFIDLQTIILEVGRSQFYNFKLGHLYQMPYTKIALERIAYFIDAFITKYDCLDKKVIILDCDNTLWKGIIGEDGLDGISCDLNQEGILYFHFQQFLKSRKDMGFLLCLCSKNNEEDVKDVFKNKRMPLEWDDFIVKKVNWEAKDNNIVEISSELNLGLDSFIFIDDSDFELARVRDNLPEVKSFKITGLYEDMLSITNDLVFEKKILSAEDINKTTQYQQENYRKNLLEKSHSFDDYLKSLDIRMQIDENKNSDLLRISQLTEKTNQFNFNKIFYTEEELKIRISENRLRCFSLKVSDKFGDYGLVGVILIEIVEDGFILENFILSCRVLGRRIEYDFLENVKRVLTKDKGKRIIQIRFKKTEKNIPAQNFYKQLIDNI